MILQSLTALYEALHKKGKAPALGWSQVKISYAVEIDDDGVIVAILPLKEESESGNKRVWLPRLIELPTPVNRSSGIAANFLFDNAGYVLGLSKGDGERAKSCFLNMAELHKTLLKNAKAQSIIALLRYFENYQVSQPPDCVTAIADELVGGANLVFMYKGRFIHEEQEARMAWQNHYEQEIDGDKLRCLITGESVVPMSTHPSIKGVRNAQSSGAAIVSFNAPAYCSFGREQSENAPVGKYGSFAYTTALNYLIADRVHNKFIGDSTVVYWAEDADEIYQDCYSEFLDGGNDVFTDQDLSVAMINLSNGFPIAIEGKEINPLNKFFVLSLSPNAARISVRMFICNTFGEAASNIREHYDRLNIVGVNKHIPFWQLTNETLRKSQGKAVGSPSSQMTGDTLRSILTNGYYPATLYQQLQLRIRADREINGIRAAIIKAYLLKNTNSSIYKEVIKVELNESTTYQPYVLGRLFAVLEWIQEKANPNINTTIKDKYFSSACATPSSIFPMLVTLSEKHLRKLDRGQKVYCDKLKLELMQLLDQSYPVHLSLYDQGIFQLGYYHQKQKRYEKKQKNNEMEEDQCQKSLKTDTNL